ncbi:Nadh-ubiquinone oxidoreductase 21 kDa subunit [Mycena venus]|uniref:Nadh-ubiquinone oxidoreductase 21 kDa subunit n=1 Tax=Mycena venus TaxID=2733690 RepID=A0A8H7D309_9AGAR|nr:Nadh-ubiquinone oxidoreductase 21 kDa subunit [Mycena venus]
MVCSNSQYSQFRFSLFPMLNLVNHPFHGTDPAKYGVQVEPAVLESKEGLCPGEMLARKWDIKALKVETDKSKSA